MQRKNIETLKANLLSNLDDDCNVSCHSIAKCVDDYLVKLSDGVPCRLEKFWIM